MFMRDLFPLFNFFEGYALDYPTVDEDVDDDFYLVPRGFLEVSFSWTPDEYAWLIICADFFEALPLDQVSGF